VILNSLWGLPPVLDMDAEKRVQQAIREMIAEHLVESAHDLSDGGFAVTLAECCFGPAGIGARVSLDSVSLDAQGPLEIALFHENPSRIIVSTDEPRKVQQLASRFQVECTQIGVTMKERVQIDNRSEWLVDCSLEDLKHPWEKALENRLGQP